MDVTDSKFINWFAGFLKTNRYSLYAPICFGGFLFFILKNVFTVLSGWWFLIIEFFCICFWGFKLIRIPQFRQKGVGILVVFPTVPRLYDEVQLITNELSRLIMGLSTQDSVKVKTTRNNFFLNSDQEIQRVLEKTKATMIVYAEFKHDKKANEDICHFREIQFLTRFPEGVISLQKDMERDFCKIRAGYSLRDTLGTRDELIEGVTIISTFMLSNALRAFGDWELAEKLLKEIRNKIPRTRSSVAIKKNISLCELCFAQDEYNRSVYCDGSFHISHDNLNNIKQRLISASQYHDYGDIFLLQAIINFLLGEEKKSIASLQRALIRAGKGNYIANLSFAFIDCYRGKPLDAAHNWNKFFNDPKAIQPRIDAVWHMINFTLFIIKLHPEKYCLYFHLSNIYRMIDLGISLEYMKSFLHGCIENHAKQEVIALAQYEVKHLGELLQPAESKETVVPNIL